MLRYLLEEGIFMFNHSNFKDIVNEIVIDITKNHYTSYGIMLSKLSEMTGIPVQILQCYNNWYILDDTFYYFKDKYIFEELFLSELAHECNVRCVDFFVAKENKSLGVISKLYRENNKKYFMYSDFCRNFFNCVPDCLGSFRLASSIVFGEEKIDKLMDDVFNFISFDIFSGQCDREEYNLFFECSDDIVRIAPLCDNGFAFQKSYMYFSPFGQLDLEDEEKIRGNLPFILSVEFKFYNKMASMLDINVEDILKRMCDKYRINVSPLDKERILSYFDCRKKSIERTLKLSNSRM